jgi:cytochrome c-type biogenesis protein CcmH/NrfG
MNETRSYFPQVIAWRYTHLAMDAYRQAIRLQPKENKWHATLGQLLASISLSANNGFIRLDFPSAQSALRELEQGVSTETDAENLLRMFKNMAGQQIPTH